MPKSFVFYFPKSSVILSKDLPRTTLLLWWPWKILTSKDSKNLRRIFNPSLSRQVFMKTPTNCWQFHLKQIRLQILTGIWTLMEDHWSRKKLKVKNSYFFEFLKFTFSNFFFQYFQVHWKWLTTKRRLIHWWVCFEPRMTSIYRICNIKLFQNWKNIAKVLLWVCNMWLTIMTWWTRIFDWCRVTLFCHILEFLRKSALVPLST